MKNLTTIIKMLFGYGNPFLEAIGFLYGVERKKWESDKNFRIRLMKRWDMLTPNPWAPL